MFCEQDDSVVHIVRYVSPEVHVETASLNSPLKQFIPALVTVSFFTFFFFLHSCGVYCF